MSASATGDPDDTPAPPAPPAPTGPRSAGAASSLVVVDPSSYVIEGEYARGGLGRVLLAHDVRLGRAVALKEILSPSPAAVARFVREARITARLQHPAIVPVYESGRWPTGEPFYAMRLVRGQSLAAAVARTRGLAERLALVPNLVAVADAVAYAHSRRVIHRDLKPENVLVGAFGETVVIDWGLARSLEDDDDEALAFEDATGDLPRHVTAVGAVIGTPAYMAPEQARGEALDERADVYALGAVLYHTLSGVAPHAGEGTREALARRANEAPTPLEARVRDVPRDLATVVRKAMAPRPEDRYPTARELAEDLRRFQTGQLVSARSYSRWTLFGRWLRQHRAAVGTAAAAAVALGLVGALSVRRVVRERNRAERALVESRARADALVLLHAQNALERDPTEALAWIRAYPSAAADPSAAWNVVIEAEARGVARHALYAEESEPWSAAIAPDGRLLAVGNLGHLRLWDLERGALRASYDLPSVLNVVFCPDGRALRVVDRRGDVYEVPLPAGAPRFLFHHGGSPRWTVSEDGRRAVALGVDATLRWFELPSGAAHALRGHEGAVLDAALASGSDGLVSAGADRTVRAWDLAQGRSRVLWNHLAPVRRVALSPDGRWVASGADDGEVRLAPWGDAAEATTRVLRQSGLPVRSLVFSVDGAHLAVADTDAAVSVWDVATGERHAVEGRTGRLYQLAFSPDGRHLAATTSDETLRLWDASGAEVAVLRGHRALDGPLVFTPNGEFAVAMDGDGTTRVWRVPPPSRTLRGHGERAIHVVFSPDGRTVATDSDDRTVRLWDVDSGRGHILGTHAERAYGVEFSRDGRYVASAGEDGRVGLWDVRAGTGRLLEGHRAEVREVAFSPREDLLASAGADGEVRLWDATTGASRVLTGHSEGVSRVAFSPDGSRLATFGGDRAVRVWDVATGASRVLASGLGDPSEGSFRVAFSPDGASVASCAGGGTVARWSLASGVAQRWRLPPGDARCSRLTFSPDGNLLAIPCSATLQLLDLGSGAWRALRGHGAEVLHFHFSPDGRFVITASADHSARVWELATGAAQVVHRHDGPVHDAAFSPDGRFVATASADGTAWVGRFDPGRGLRPDPVSVRARVEALTSVVIVEGRPRSPLRRSSDAPRR